MIIHLFIISSAVQIYEFSYIHYHQFNVNLFQEWRFSLKMKRHKTQADRKTFERHAGMN